LGAALSSAGFEGRFPHYRRASPSGLQLLSVQYHSSATELVLEFGTLAGDVSIEALSPAELLPRVLLFERARLHTESGRWFTFGRYGEGPEPYEALAASIVEMLPQVEAWFRTGEAGPNVRVLAL
jgi:hypothetical protein